MARASARRRPWARPGRRCPVPAGARDLSRGNPDPALLPDPAEALAHIPLPKRLYGERPVIEQLAQLAREQLEADGVNAQELCVVSGALDGIERVLQTHATPRRPHRGREPRLRGPV